MTVWKLWNDSVTFNGSHPNDDGKGIYTTMNGAQITMEVEENYQTVHIPKPKIIIGHNVDDLELERKFTKTGENLWGLRNPTWNISKLICDYYLLTLASILDKDKYTKYLDRKTVVLADQFTRYTDMAVGGELRHAKAKTDSGTWTWDQLPRPIVQALYDYTINGGGAGISRNGAWEGWYHFRQRYGTIALKWAIDVFSLEGWGNGYGGTRWANIANTLYMYEKGDTTTHTFVDTCFGLQHNGGIYFNKWWSTQYLGSYLDYNQQGLYCNLYKNATSMVRKIVTYDLYKEACTCQASGCQG